MFLLREARMKKTKLLFLFTFLLTFSGGTLFANAIDAALADVDYMVQD